ncbi:MAG TPA: GDP-mannose 4,6 dehydratase [Micrococcales bacterium]|uniref:GDP-mannose 4,6-dehydratase n=1 Tax=Miniimonas arenae TaxID=676201 RepID=UPI000EBCCA2A|nr:GDP-mannose 4,6-dehydratase [Miniimonas arenae]HCX84382.1 GDP-mannose 4,6 dehydratase [Micrococcales bacterium]
MTVVLVTGAAGQDGYYLCRRLGREGCDVHALLRPGTSPADPRVRDLRTVAPSLTFHEVDLARTGRLSPVIEAIAPDEIYNLAGMSSVARSWEDPVGAGEVNGLAAASLLEAAHALQESSGRQVRLLQASSAEIFGSAAESPQSEATPVRPTSPYGAAKAYAHHMVEVYRQRGLHATSLVLYNHESPRRPLTFVTRKITHGVARISLGLETELVLGSLDVQRDWGWAPDYMDAAVAAVRADRAQDYVVATGVAHTVREFVAAAFACVGVTRWEPYVRTDPAFVRPVDPSVQLGDAGRAAADLGWRPTMDFDGIVSAMVANDVEELSRSQGGERPFPVR